jgi:hypothetical protein
MNRRKLRGKRKECDKMIEKLQCFIIMAKWGKNMGNRGNTKRP